MKRLIIILFTFIVTLIISPTKILADGMIVPRPNRIVDETDQKAVIWHDGKTETLILSITFKGDTDEFAWIIPVPAKPEVDAGVDELFTGLAQLTNISYNDVGSFGAVNLAPGGISEKSTVSVIETKKVDIYDIAVLTAEDTTDLREWLEENDYEYPENKEHLLKSYVNKNWYFVAAKVNAESLGVAQGLKTGHATPLKITFDSEKIVYPLKISGMEADIKPTTTSNKIINAFSFENGATQGWYGGRVIDDNFAQHGKKVYSQLFTYSPQSNSLPTMKNYVSRTISNLTIGRNYVFSAYVKASSETTGYARLTVDNLNFTSNLVNLKDLENWVRIELTFNATKNYYQFNLSGEEVSTSSTLYWDAIQIEEGTAATEFTKELITTTNLGTIHPIDNTVDIILYVFSDHKQEAPGWRADYAGKVDSGTIKRLAVDDNGDPWINSKNNMYLTRLSRTMRQSEMTSDVYLRQSVNDTPIGKGSESAPFANIGLRIFLVLGIPILVETAIFGYIWYRRYKK